MTLGQLARKFTRDELVAHVTLPIGGSGMLIAFICGALCNAEQLSDFVSKAQDRGLETQVYIPKAGLLDANHTRDLLKIQEDIDQKLSEKSQPLAFFAFSAGGKFATKIALTRDVKGVFLLDPVDGPPPFQKESERFPIFLKDATPAWRDKGTGPAVLSIVRTELGEKNGLGGAPCVTKAFGSGWFATQLGAAPSEIQEIKDAGHLDTFAKPPALGRLVCPKGNSKTAPQEAVAAFESFLTKMELANPSP